MVTCFNSLLTTPSPVMKKTTKKGFLEPIFGSLLHPFTLLTILAALLHGASCDVTTPLVHLRDGSFGGTHNFSKLFIGQAVSEKGQ